MAESSKEAIAGQVTAAMAWRVKYRKVDKDDRPLKMKLPVNSLGVHPNNRAGIYPSGIRCKSLCQEVVEAGFIQEDVDHAGVAVEEVPIDHVRSRGVGYVSGLKYNTEKCAKDEHLLSCFEAPHNDVRHMLLSHNHMMLILRAWMSQAKWDLPADNQKGIKYCDHLGRLSVAEVAEHQNGKELALVCEEGITMEILSWKMDVEEPTAASTISNALNSGHQMAMRTTELTAVAVLQGEILVQLSMHVGQRVAFQTVRESVRLRLGHVADDPDLRDIFDYLIGAGVGTNSYIGDLLDFTSKFVDSKKRQLRYSAFGAANAISAEAPWTKIAVIKRAYRKKPSNGFCPSPEADWAKYENSHLNCLEQLLRWVHVKNKDAVEALPPQSRNTLLGNFDVAAAEAFFVAKSQNRSMAKVQESMIEATLKYVKQLGLKEGELTCAGATWIDYTQCGQAEAAKQEDPGDDIMKAAPAVIRFDEATGQQLNSQVAFDEVQKKQAGPPIILPWRTWHQSKVSMGTLEADKASAVAALHNLHQSVDYHKMPIEVIEVNGSVRVVTNEKVTKNSIYLPPCTPRQSKVHEKTEHPYAAKMTLKVMRAIESLEHGSVLREQTLHVLPEWKIPQRKENTAVAGEPGSTAADHIEWIWGDNEAETMHPFWAVRRLTDKQLQVATIAKQPTDLAPRFNCELQTKSLSCVTIATLDGKCCNRTRILEVPFLTNSMDLEKGEELVMQLIEKAKKAAPKRSWRDAEKDLEKDLASQKKRRAKAHQEDPE